jgi:hypothetical protein
MARKPAPSLPDVFANTALPTPRGPALEELPEPPPAPVIEAVAVEPQFEPPPPPPPTVPFGSTESEDAYEPPVRPPVSSGKAGMMLAALAVMVSLTAPFWEDQMLSIFGIRTPIGRAAEESRLAVMRQEAEAADIGQRLTTALGQIERQQAQFASAVQRTERAQVMIRTLALVRLSDTLRRPMPFAPELAMAQATGANLGAMKPLLDQIQPYADTGIPGAVQLREEFTALFERLPKGRGNGWVNDLAAWAHLRRPPPATEPPDPSLGLLQSASERLADMDVAGAVDQTAQVSDAYRAVFANWLEDAKARVAADTIAARVSQMVTQALQMPAAR